MDDIEKVIASSPHPLTGGELPLNVGGAQDYSHEQMQARYVGGTMDPAFGPTQGRTQVVNPNIGENSGAAYGGIQMGLDRAVNPALGPTSANGRIVMPHISRESTSAEFYGASSY